MTETEYRRSYMRTSIQNKKPQRTERRQLQLDFLDNDGFSYYGDYFYIISKVTLLSIYVPYVRDQRIVNPDNFLMQVYLKVWFQLNLLTPRSFWENPILF